MGIRSFTHPYPMHAGTRARQAKGEDFDSRHRPPKKENTQNEKSKTADNSWPPDFWSGTESLEQLQRARETNGDVEYN